MNIGILKTKNALMKLSREKMFAIGMKRELRKIQLKSGERVSSVILISEKPDTCNKKYKEFRIHGSSIGMTSVIRYTR